MDERIISYVQINTFLNQPIYITAELGVMKCPKLSDLNGDLILYSSQVSTYITLYDENNNDFFDKLISENKIQDFALFAKSFFDYDQVKIINNEIFYFKHIVKDNEELDVMIGCLNNNTISIFMDVIKISLVMLCNSIKQGNPD